MYPYVDETPFSHFETVCLTTFSLIASSSCEIPFDFLSFLMFSLSIIYASLFLMAQFYGQTSHCHKQRILTSSCLPVIAARNEHYNTVLASHRVLYHNYHLITTALYPQLSAVQQIILSFQMPLRPRPLSCCPYQPASRPCSPERMPHPTNPVPTD